MINIKFTLIIVAFSMLLVAGHQGVFAKEHTEGKDKKNLIKVDIPLIDVTLPSPNSPSPKPKASEPAPTTASPSSSPSPEPEPVVSASPSPESSFFTPIINFFAPHSTRSTPVEPRERSASTSTAAAVVGSSGQVNDSLSDGFFSSNYYGGHGFDAGTTRSLKIAGFLSAVLGVLLVAGNRVLSARIN